MPGKRQRAETARPISEFRRWSLKEEKWLYTCTTCGTEGIWAHGWAYYASDEDEDNDCIVAVYCAECPKYKL